MSPTDAIAASRVKIAVDESYEPLVFYCSLGSMSYVRRQLCNVGQVARARALKHLGEHEPGKIRIQLVPMLDAEKTNNWEPVSPKMVIDYLADLARP